jgi:hypothetical protein
MKAALLALLFASSSIAYASSNNLPAACGAKGIGFDVNLEHAQHTLVQPDPGKARVYFVQNLGAHNYIAQINVGLDGSWVGANRDDSYFSVSVDPGEHHLCENVKSHFHTYGKLVEVAHFIAEPGKTYYYRAELSQGETGPHLLLAPIDSDEGDQLIRSYPLSVSHPKK